MKQIRSIIVLSLLFIAFSCKKKEENPYGPCEEAPIGTTPLNFYNVQLGVRNTAGSNLIDFIWPKDSVRLYDEFENEIEINWLKDLSGHYVTEPIYFFDYAEDSVAFNSLFTNKYYIDFHEYNFIDRDTVKIIFSVEDVTCGQILSPLEFYQNEMLRENYGDITTRRVNLIK